MVSKVGKNLQRINGFQDGDGVKDSSVYLDAHTAVAEVRGRDAGVAAFVVRALSSTNLPTEVFRVDKDGAVSGALAPPPSVGTADAGPAINAALNAACAQGGGVVTLRAGTYRIATQIVIPCDGITLEGAGPGRTILESGAVFAAGMVAATARSNMTLRNMTLRLRSGDGGYCYYISGHASVQTTDILLEDLHLDVLAADGSGGVLSGVQAGFARVTLRGVRATSPAASTGTVGLQIGSGDLGVVSTDLLVEGCTTDGFVTGIHNGTSGTWTGMRIADCRFAGARKWGAYLYHMDRAQVVNCEFASCDVGAFMDDDAGAQGGLVTGCAFRDNLTIGLYREEWAKGAVTGCTFQGNGYGFWVASARTCAIAGCSFYGNTRAQLLVEPDATITSLASSGPAQGATYAITNLVAIQDLVISGCSITGGSRHGIDVAGVQRGFRIVGCDISQNGQADSPTPTTYAGINLRASTLGTNNYAVAVEDCVIGNLAGSGTDTGYQKFGITSTGATLTELEVVGGRIEGVDTPLDIAAGAVKVGMVTFKTCGPVGTLPAGYDWGQNRIVGGTMTPPIEAKGGDTAAANDLVLAPRRVGLVNVYRITGATQINHIAATGWPSGSIVVLIFSSNPLVKHGTATSGANKTLVLAGGVDFAATSFDSLVLVYDADTSDGWYEISRTVV